MVQEFEDKEGPRYGLNEDGTLDEIFAEATHVHVEQMDDSHWWIGVILASGETLHINFWTPRTRIRATYMEDWAGGLEGGEFNHGVRAPESDRVRRY